MDHEPALADVAVSVDVPGAPYSLRLDDVTSAGDEVRLAWSFVALTGESERLHGSTTVAGDDAATAWRAAQLDAAYRLRSHLDLDTRPGEPYVPLHLAEDEAWRLLVEHLGRGASRVEETDGAVTAYGLDERGEYVSACLRTDAATWAAFVNRFADDPMEDQEVDEDGWVPTAVVIDGGLPLWVTDELTGLGAWSAGRIEGGQIVAVRD